MMIIKCFLKRKILLTFLILNALLILFPQNAHAGNNDKNEVHRKKESLIIISYDENALTFREVSLAGSKTKVIKKLTGIYINHFGAIHYLRDGDNYFYKSHKLIIRITNSPKGLNIKKIFTYSNRPATSSLKDSVAHSMDIKIFDHTLYCLLPYTDLMVVPDRKELTRESYREIINDEQSDRKYNVLDIGGGAYINKDIIVYLANTTGPGNTIQDRNILIIIHKQTEKIEVFNAGYALMPNHFTEYFRNINVPLVVSPNRKQLAFITRCPDKNEKEFKANSLPVYLAIFDLITKRLKIVTALNQDSYKSIEWNPVKTNIIAVADEHAPSRMMIIDTTKEKGVNVLYTLRPAAKKILAMHWSPDGKELGYIDSNGRLSIFNMETRRTKTIDINMDNNDFIWK